MNNGTKNGTTTSKQTFNATLSEQGRPSIKEGCRKGEGGAGFGKPFEAQNPEYDTQKKHPRKHAKNNHGETWKMMTQQC